MDDAVMVNPPCKDSIGDEIDDCSMDDSFSVVNGRHRSDEPPPSLNSAMNSDGDPYEQRKDIKELKAMEIRIKDTLQLYDGEKISDIRQRVDALKNIDQEIVSQMEELEGLLKDKDGTNTRLVESAENALESMKKSQKVANEGKTTLKRAMEINQLAIPIFQSVWRKNLEKVEVDEKVMEELEKFEQSRDEVARAGLNIEKRIKKSKEFKDHIGTAIDLAEQDVKRLMEKKELEVSEKRTELCKEIKSEIAVIVESEVAEVDAWMVTCHKDQEQIDKFRQEQFDRHEQATKDYETEQKRFAENLRANKFTQEQLKKQLEELKVKETKLDADRMFQMEVQKKATELHEKIVVDLTNRYDAMDSIQKKADTARQVVEFMNTCGSVLVDASFEAENEYLDNLSNVEKLSKINLRLALANDYVETRIKIEHSTKNMDECTESMKVFKDKWKKAAQAQSTLNVKKNKDLYKEYKKEMEREKKIKEECETELEVLTHRLSTLEHDLDKMKAPYMSLEDMYELRMQEYMDANNEMGSLSMENSSDELSEDDDDFEDSVE